jgi:hypothetical protein
MGCSRYYLKDKMAETSERVGWTHIVNIPAARGDAERGFRWMAFSAMAANEEKERTGATGRRIERPVWSQSFSWSPHESPTKEQMIEAAQSWMSAFNLDDHQAVIVQHTDTPHPHCHLILSLLNPQTNKVAELGYSKLRSSKWAEEYERENSGIICKQREENNAKREQGEYVRYQEPDLDLKIDLRAKVTEMYHAARSGADFQSALEAEGFTIAQGGKRLVIIDANGKAHSLWRQVDGAKAREIKTKLADLELPTAEEALAAREERVQRRELEETNAIPSERGQDEERENQKERNEQASDELSQSEEKQTPAEQEQDKYFDRDAYEQRWHDTLIQSAINAGLTKSSEEHSPPLAEETAERSQSSPEDLKAAPDTSFEQLQTFHSENYRRRQELAARLDAEHGESERRLRRESDRLDNHLRNSGRVKRMWLWLSGQIPRNANERSQTMRGELQSIEASKTAARDALENQIAVEKTALEAGLHQADSVTHQRSPSFERWRKEYAQSQQQSDLEEDQGPTLEW